MESVVPNVRNSFIQQESGCSPSGYLISLRAVASSMFTWFSYPHMPMITSNYRLSTDITIIINNKCHEYNKWYMKVVSLPKYLIALCLFILLSVMTWDDTRPTVQMQWGTTQALRCSIKLWHKTYLTTTTMPRHGSQPKPQCGQWGDTHRIDILVAGRTQSESVQDERRLNYATQKHRDYSFLEISV